MDSGNKLIVASAASMVGGRTYVVFIKKERVSRVGCTDDHAKDVDPDMVEFIIRPIVGRYITNETVLHPDHLTIEIFTPYYIKSAIVSHRPIVNEYADEPLAYPVLKFTPNVICSVLDCSIYCAQIRARREEFAKLARARRDLCTVLYFGGIEMLAARAIARSFYPHI